MAVMSSGNPHQTQDLQTRPCVQWLGPDLLHHVSDCAPLPVWLQHSGTLWDLQWLPLLAGERRYSTGCSAWGLSAPGQDHKLVRLCMHVCMCMGMCWHGAWCAQGLWWLCSPKSNAGEPETT